MLNNKNKIILIFSKLLLAAAIEVLVSYFDFIFFNNDRNGNISSLTHVFLKEIWSFFIFYFISLVLTAYVLNLLTTLKNVYIKKYFLWVGFLTNAVIFSSFLIIVGALYFTIHVLSMVIQSGIFGMLTAYFLKPLSSRHNLPIHRGES